MHTIATSSVKSGLSPFSLRFANFAVEMKTKRKNIHGFEDTRSQQDSLF